jgi:hypothetical protein
MQRLIAEPHQSSDWTRISPMFERPIYRRRTIESPPAEVESEQAAGAAASAAPTPRAKQSTKPGGFNNPFAGLADLVKDGEQ